MTRAHFIPIALVTGAVFAGCGHDMDDMVMRPRVHRTR